MDISLMDALIIATTIVGSLVTFATGYEKLILQPRERKKLEKEKEYAELRDKERQDLVEIRKQEYDELLETIKEVFRPQVERGERTKLRVDKIEVVVDDHDKRIATLESDKDGNFTYREHYRGEEKE